MSPHKGPTGNITYDETETETETPEESLTVRWLGPRRPRRLGAALLLVSAVATFWVNAAVMGRSFARMPTGVLAVLEFAPLVTGAVVTLGLAVFVLGGSPASRVLGILAAVAGLLPLVLPLVLFGLTYEDLGPMAVPWAAALTLHLATILALLWPPGSARSGRRAGRDDEREDGSVAADWTRRSIEDEPPGNRLPLNDNQFRAPTGFLVHQAKRLLTSIDVNGADSGMSISALLALELVDGHRVTLLDDRGWSSSGGSNAWASTSLQALAETARTVVGPDEPPKGASPEDQAALHWAHLAEKARAQGVRVEARDLAALPHDVDISQEIKARVAPTSR